MLPRTLRTAVNKLAHAEGIAHAETVKRRVLAELEALRGTGATHADLLAHVHSWTPKGETK